MKQSLHIADEETKRVFDGINEVIETSEDIFAISYALITCLANAIVAQATVKGKTCEAVYFDYGVILASTVQQIEREIKERPINLSTQESKWKM